MTWTNLTREVEREFRSAQRIARGILDRVSDEAEEQVVPVVAERVEAGERRRRIVEVVKQ